MKRLGVFLLGFTLILACKSQPPEIENYSVEETVMEEQEEEAPNPGAPFQISQEVYDFTLAEVKLFVDDLNAIIQKKNFNDWKNSLSDELLTRISSPEFLENASQSAALKARKIVLKTPNDYFTHVVVPSRSNSKVDEIEFTAINKVKVFYLEERRRNDTTAGFRRLRLYELIKVDDTWKIID